MSQPPTPYSRQYNFAGWSITHPTTPHQGNKLDQEYNAILSTVNQTIARLSEIQRDDGTLKLPASQSVAKAWVTFDGTGSSPSIISSFNVSSVTRSSTGSFLINFTTALPSTGYCWSASARGSTSDPVHAYQSVVGNVQTPTQMSLLAADSAGAVNPPFVSVVIYG